MTDLRLVARDEDRELELLGAPVRFSGRSADPLTELVSEDIAAHYQHYGLCPSWRGALDDALAMLADAHLTGCGGGHYPVAKKWRTAHESAARHNAAPVIIANGAEGEPGSAKDAALMELRPHLVIDGIRCTAQALDAAEAVVWLHESAHGARTAMTRAVAERRRRRVDDPPIRLMVAPDHYLSGESSAAVAGVSGRRALPTFSLVPAAARGVHGRPTLVHNVETLARVAMLARGRDRLPALLTVTHHDQRVVVEAAAHHTVAGRVRIALGRRSWHAVLVGGYGGGTWCRWPDLESAVITRGRVTGVDVSLGAGVLMPVAEGECGLAAMARIGRYLAESSARQCGPCVFGVPAIADALDDLAAGRGSRKTLPRLIRLTEDVDGRGACHLPDGVVTMVRSGLSVFEADVVAHLGGRCLAERRPHARGWT